MAKRTPKVQDLKKRQVAQVDADVVRTPWYPRSVNPVHKGWYECGAQISRSVPNMLIRLRWDGVGFLTDFPLIVNMWRGISKADHDKLVRTIKSTK